LCGNSTEELGAGRIVGIASQVCFLGEQPKKGKAHTASSMEQWITPRSNNMGEGGGYHAKRRGKKYELSSRWTSGERKGRNFRLIGPDRRFIFIGEGGSWEEHANGGWGWGLVRGQGEVAEHMHWPRVRGIDLRS